MCIFFIFSFQLCLPFRYFILLCHLHLLIHSSILIHCCPRRPVIKLLKRQSIYPSFILHTQLWFKKKTQDPTTVGRTSCSCTCTWLAAPGLDPQGGGTRRGCVQHSEWTCSYRQRDERKEDRRANQPAPRGLIPLLHWTPPSHNTWALWERQSDRQRESVSVICSDDWKNDIITEGKCKADFLFPINNHYVMFSWIFLQICKCSKCDGNTMCTCGIFERCTTGIKMKVFNKSTSVYSKVGVIILWVKAPALTVLCENQTEFSGSSLTGLVKQMMLLHFHLIKGTKAETEAVPLAHWNSSDLLSKHFTVSAF